MSGEVDPKKKTLFVIEKYVEDTNQDEKHVPDLLEAIIQTPGLEKEELRLMSFKMIKIGSKIKNIQVSFFFGFRKSAVFPSEANASPLASRFQAKTKPS